MKNILAVIHAFNYVMGNCVLAMVIVWLLWKDTLPPEKAVKYVQNLWIILGFANLYWVAEVKAAREGWEEFKGGGGLDASQNAGKP